MFRHRPALAAELLAGPLGMAVPPYGEARLGSSEVTELRPAEHRADVVVVLRDGPSAVLAVVVEVQLRVDPEKKLIWPDYVTGVRRRVRCPTRLLVVCADPVTAEWAAAPIDLDGAGSVIVPALFGPDRIPVLTDPEEASRTPELAVFSALAHVRDDGPFAVLDAMAVALDRIEPELAGEYAQIVLAQLSHAARAHLEELMATETFEYQSEFTRRLEARGEVRARRETLVQILAARDVDVPSVVRERIAECDDVEQLKVWATRAVHATTVDDLFA